MNKDQRRARCREIRSKASKKPPALVAYTPSGKLPRPELPKGVK